MKRNRWSALRRRYLLNAPCSGEGQLFGPPQEALDANWIRIRLRDGDCEVHFASPYRCLNLSMRCLKTNAGFREVDDSENAPPVNRAPSAKAVHLSRIGSTENSSRLARISQPPIPFPSLCRSFGWRFEPTALCNLAEAVEHY